jgi:hypothetical protein
MNGGCYPCKLNYRCRKTDTNHDLKAIEQRINEELDSSKMQLQIIFTRQVMKRNVWVSE